jgi:hypothetical protein
VSNSKQAKRQAPYSIDPPGANRSRSSKAPENPTENLERLADMLIARHVRVAIPDLPVRDSLAESLRTNIHAFDLVERDMHCIAVVGAGASSPLMKRADELADELEARFERDKAELDRLQLVYNLNPEAFETRLIALSKNPDAKREVRRTISEKYNVQHPTLLGYELLAHMLKHRFLDAIISFNFDELLDRSLDDELDASEFERVVSERDCQEIQTDPSRDDYVPLYVKLHGTASEPDSLRFTADSYYTIPQSISDIVQKLLRAEHCVLVNVGSGLATFDLQHLLRIPQELDVFNLSANPVERSAIGEINKVRRKPKPNRNWLHECNESGGQPKKDPSKACQEQLKRLTEVLMERIYMSKQSEPSIVQFRSVQRHEVVAELLGPETIHREWAATPGWPERELTEYARRRTILELALVGAKARGLLSLAPLVVDRPARYYDDYQRRAKDSAEEWSALCSAAGLVESEEIPDILLSQKCLRMHEPAKRRTNGSSGEQPEPETLETRVLHKFDPDKLAGHVLARVRNPPPNDDALERLTETLNNIQNESEIEHHMRDDRVCSKAFSKPRTLPTATSLEAYTRLVLSCIGRESSIYISSETGEWLRRKPFKNALRNAGKIQLLLAFNINRQNLEKEYRVANIEVATIDPWRHNRHMTIVCQDESPVCAIYFARRLRDPVITAVYLHEIRDVQLLKQMYDQRWKEAKREEEPTGEEEEETQRGVGAVTRKT